MYKVVKYFGSYRFCEQICDLIGSSKIFKMNNARFDEVAQVMIFPENMLVMLVIDRIFGHGNAGHIVFPDNGKHCH